jgi:GTP cyclohydrolase II
VTPFDSVQHFAFVHGDLGDGQDVPTRLHRVDIVADVIKGGTDIKKVFARFKDEGRGVFIYLRDGAAGVPARTTAGNAPSSEISRSEQWKDVGLGAQILRDLGISSIRLRTATPRTYVGLSGFGIEIKSYEPPF